MGSAVRVCVYTCLAILFGLGDSIGFFEMGQKMPAYPMFLLYFTTLLYVTLYLAWSCANIALDRDRKRSFGDALLAREHQNLFFQAGIWLTVNGLCSQFADPYVNGNLQTVLYQLTVPTTGVLAWYYMKTRFNGYNWLGSLMVLGGCLFVALPPMLETHSPHHHHGGLSNLTTTTTTTTAPTTTSVFDPHDKGCGGSIPTSPSNNPIWVIVFTLSVLPNSVCWVIQERLFHKDKHLDPMLLLFWSNFYTLIFYVLALPLTLAKGLGGLSLEGLLQNQRNAFVCITDPSTPVCGCEPDAIVAIMVFVVGYMGRYFFLALLIKEVGSVFESLVYAVVTPMSAICFSFRWLLGKEAEPLTAWIICGAVLVTLGIVVFNYLEIEQFFKGTSPGDEDREPLLAPTRVQSGPTYTVHTDPEEAFVVNASATYSSARVRRTPSSMEI